MGAILTPLLRHLRLQTCAPSSDTSQKDEDCPAGEKLFKKPWTQNLQMFFGEALMINLFILNRRRSIASSTHSQTPQVRSTPSFVFLLPACCDVLGTGVGGVGMLYISASVWQMMRGSLMVFTSFLSVIFLKRKLYAYNWLAVLISASGLALVGLSAIMDEKETSAGKNVILGILLTIVSQMFAASQMVVEELFVKSYQAPPEQVVGSEGIWGIAIMIVMLTVMLFIPGKDAGAYENVLDSAHMLTSSGLLAMWVLIYLFSIACFNFLGVTISGKLSAVHRTINDALRTAIVWGVQLVLNSCGSKYGAGWTEHSWMQLLGFLCLIMGSLTNHMVVRFPCLYYPPPAVPLQDPSQSTATPALSLIDPTEQEKRTGNA